MNKIVSDIYKTCCPYKPRDPVQSFVVPLEHVRACYSNKTQIKDC